MVTFKDLGRYGRIGNQMFQIASVIGIATKCGLEYGFPEWKNYDHLERFGFTENIDIQKWFKNPLPKMIDGNYSDIHIKWGYHDVRVNDWTNITGHMQSEKYFLHCQDVIRYYFTFKHQTQKREAIAVHFRGGDYGDNYHPHCTKEYYQEALGIFKGEVLVFSDDPDMAEKVIGYPAVRGNHSMIDMELMSRCSHHIIANSTFSWWAAWLSGSKNVIAPKKWFGPQAKISSNDLYCEGWIVI